MSNIGFLHLNKHIPLNRLVEEIDKISKERFKGSVKATIFSDSKTLDSWGNEIIVVDYNDKYIVTLVYDKNILEWHHRLGVFISYVEETIKNILSEKYNAFIGDEGIGYEKYKGKDKKLGTFYDYLVYHSSSISKKKLSWLKKRRLKKFAKEEADYFEDGRI